MSSAHRHGAAALFAWAALALWPLPAPAQEAQSVSAWAEAGASALLSWTPPAGVGDWEALPSWLGSSWIEGGLRAASGRAKAELRARLAIASVTGLAPELSVILLYAKAPLGPLSLSLGRQILNLGKGKAFSPVDIFTTLMPGPLASTRTGSDSARLSLPAGDMGVVECLAAPSLDPALGSYALRGAWALDFADISFLTAYQGALERLALGADAKGDILDVSAWAEAIAFFPLSGASADSAPSADWLLGAEWSDGSWAIEAEWEQSGFSAFEEGRWGFCRLWLLVAYAAEDFWSLAAGAVYDGGGGAATPALVLTTSPAQDASLELGLFGAFLTDPLIEPRSLALKLDITLAF